MLRASKSPDVPWRPIHFIGEQLNKICFRDAFADARRAQTARLLAQQVGPPFDNYRGRAWSNESSGRKRLRT
jgi:hypothetical protein